MESVQNQIVLAHKYAQGFFQVYSSCFTQEAYEQVRYAKIFFRSHAKILRIFSLASLKEGSTEGSSTSILPELLRAKGSLPHFFLPLLALLLKHKRSALLPEVLEQITLLYCQANETEEIIIWSSSALSEEQVKTIQAFISKRRVRKIISTVQIDPSLIAGVRIQGEQFLWEYSVRGQFRNISI